MARSLETIIMDTVGHDPIATFNFGNFKVLKKRAIFNFFSSIFSKLKNTNKLHADFARSRRI